MGDEQPLNEKDFATVPLKPENPSHPPRVSDEVKNYYSKTTGRPDLFSKWFNIDLDSNVPAAKSYLNSPSTRNFVVDFGEKEAWCAPNLEKEDLVALLKTERPPCFEARWINIWCPELQKESVRAITNHYGLSGRLQKMMLADPKNPPTPKPDTGSWSHNAGKEDDDEDEDDYRTSDDIEEGLRRKTISSTFEASKENIGTGNLGFADIVNEIWHFSTVDYGTRYLCIGYNSIYSVPKVRFQPSSSSLPDSKRVWSWLIVCDDATVISIQENPFPQPATASSTTHSPEEKAKTMEIVRRNAVVVFSGISNAPRAEASTAKSLMTMRVRQFAGKEKNSGTTPNECASLLFYAIFDDWLTIYNVVAKREQPYGAALGLLRGEMLKRPKVELIDELHRMGRQLGVLKRIYKTYENTVNRLLQHQQRMLRDRARSNGNSSAELNLLAADTDPELVPLVGASVGVRLSASAIVRFERLADRIGLYVLGEIEDCLNEKATLTFLNFNLIALKDSQAVEKLTRITVLLAKATMMFLPVSLMTAYFSTEIPELQEAYTATTYWVCFAVISVLSIIVIWSFGFASDKIKGNTTYRSLGKTFYDISRTAIGQGKKKARRRKVRAE